MTQQSYELPDLDHILDHQAEESDTTTSAQQKQVIEQTLAAFGLTVKVGDVRTGPTLTQFGLKLGSETKISHVKRLDQDLSLALAGRPVWLEDPTPNYPYLRLVILNEQPVPVSLRQVLTPPAYQKQSGHLKVGLGLDSFARPLTIDLAEMPHLLIGGMTGSGKSTCLNAMLASLLCAYPPDVLHLALIDPLRIELEAYGGIPHLFAPLASRLRPVVDLLEGLNSAIDRRFTGFSKLGLRNILAYNQQARQTGREPLPYLVVLVDNLTDLILRSGQEIEPLLTRLAAMGRGAGVHLVIATQRSNVEIVSGALKANATARIAFKVTSNADSRLILDATGAENLFGPGDMLYKAPNAGLLQRVQGTRPSPAEIDRLIGYWQHQ
jgi:S-DNA-T family DNA segregation ATPase FtsK/SpoIIIE